MCIAVERHRHLTPALSPIEAEREGARPTAQNGSSGDSPFRRTIEIELSCFGLPKPASTMFPAQDVRCAKRGDVSECVIGSPAVPVQPRIGSARGPCVFAFCSFSIRI